MISPMRIYSSIRGVTAIYNFDNENTWNLHITATVSKMYNYRNVAQKEILFGQNLLLGSKFKSCWRRGWRCGDIKTQRAFIFVHQKSSSLGNCQTIKAGIKGGNSSLMGFQTRQIRTGKLQHKRWDGKYKGCFCLSWLLCPNDGLNLYSTPIVWMYEAVFTSSSYSVPSSAKFL